MALLARFSNVMLSHPCSHCGHVLEKKGSWFTVVGRYTCSGCGTQAKWQHSDADWRLGFLGPDPACNRRTAEKTEKFPSSHVRPRGELPSNLAALRVIAKRL